MMNEFDQICNSVTIQVFARCLRRAREQGISWVIRNGADASSVIQTDVGEDTRPEPLMSALSPADHQ